MQTPSAPTRRVFLALWPDDCVREQLALHANQWTWGAGCEQYQPADWHVTLHFIGNVGANQSVQIAANAGVPIQPFELVMDQPSIWHQGLAVVGATKVPKPLQSLHDRLGQVLRRMGLNIETRPYRPHVTLARQAGEAILPTKCLPVVWRVRSFALVVSTGDRIHRYQVIHQYF